ncbi:hypothetical protein Tco_1514990 [Tanacetum coccineum]
MVASTAMNSITREYMLKVSVMSEASRRDQNVCTPSVSLKEMGESMDALSQKLKLRWAIEGDENLKSESMKESGLLIDVLEAFGFGSTWSSTWIAGCSIMEKKFRYLGVNGRERMSLTRHGLVLCATSNKNRLGLSVIEYFALNSRRLLLKWVWSCLSDSQDGSLWFRVIQAEPGIRIDLITVRESHLSWSAILMKEVHVLKSTGFDFMSYCSKRIGDYQSTSFWLETWKGDIPFRDMFPRLFALESAKHICVADKCLSL